MVSKMCHVANTQGRIRSPVSLLVASTAPPQVRDAGNLLTGCGFGIPTVDVDDVVVQYDGVVDLIDHLRTLGEGNAVLRRRPTLQ